MEEVLKIKKGVYSNAKWGEGRERTAQTKKK